MPLPPDINTDLIIARLLGMISGAVDGWRRGFPRDETALLNRVTEQLLYGNRCDVGTIAPCLVRTEIYALHRMHRGRADKFGSDLAVTIEAPEAGFKKTAFFQFKIAGRCRAVLTRRQLKEARRIKVIRERAFVFAVDESSDCFRIRGNLPCLREIPHAHEQETFDILTWTPLSEWVIAWFKCQEGKLTVSSDPCPPEKYLEGYRLGNWEKTVHERKPDDFLPARVWAITRFLRPQ